MPRIVSRVIIIDDTTQSILLVRNDGSNYFYPPGGGWEPDTGESLEQGAIREVFEETGLEVDIIQLYSVQEYREGSNMHNIEFFWLATPLNVYNPDHKDTDPNGQVAEARWFNQSELQRITVFPEYLKDRFWEEMPQMIKLKKRFELVEVKK